MHVGRAYLNVFVEIQRSLEVPLSKEDLLDELGIDLGPVRLKCALLPLKVVKVAAFGIDGSDGENDQD